MKCLIHGVLAVVVAFTLALPATADAQATIKKTSHGVQMLLKERVLPFNSVDPAAETLSIAVGVEAGNILLDALPVAALVPNAKGTKWNYKVKPTGEYMIYKAQIKEKQEKNGDRAYDVKMKMTVSGFYLIHNNERILLFLSVGDDVFYLDEYFDRVPRKTYKPWRAWKLNFPHRDYLARYHVCGDGTQQVGEACDGDNDDACPGQCQPNCTCP
jgi:hypothetical protein